MQIIAFNYAHALQQLFFKMGSPKGQARRLRGPYYTCEQLREIRKKNGVGRPPKVNLKKAERYWP